MTVGLIEPLSKAEIMGTLTRKGSKVTWDTDYPELYSLCGGWRYPTLTGGNRFSWSWTGWRDFLHWKSSRKIVDEGKWRC